MRWSRIGIAAANSSNPSQAAHVAYPHGDQADPRQSSAHISRETKAWLPDPGGTAFEFTFTANRGSWLNLVEGFFSKLTRSVPRHIRVASKQELKDRLIAAVDYFNREADRASGRPR
jgi:hypothetical protein